MLAAHNEGTTGGFPTTHSCDPPTGGDFQWRNTEEDGIGPTTALAVPAAQPSYTGEISCAQVDDPTDGYYCITRRAVTGNFTACFPPGAFTCADYGEIFTNGTDGSMVTNFPPISDDTAPKEMRATQTQTAPRFPYHVWYRSGLRFRINDQLDAQGTWTESDAFELEVGGSLLRVAFRPNQVVGFDLVYAFFPGFTGTEIRYMCNLDNDGDFLTWEGPDPIYTDLTRLITSGIALGSEPDGTPFLAFSEDNPATEIVILKGESRTENCSTATWTEVTRLAISSCTNIGVDEDIIRLANGNYAFIYSCFGDIPTLVRTTAPTADGPWEVEDNSSIIAPTMTDVTGEYMSLIVGGTGNLFMSFQTPTATFGEYLLVTVQSISQDTFL